MSTTAGFLNIRSFVIGKYSKYTKILRLIVLFIDWIVGILLYILTDLLFVYCVKCKPVIIRSSP